MKKRWILIVVPLAIFLGPYFALKANQYIIDHKPPQPLSDQELRQKALKAGFASNPKSFEELLQLYPPQLQPTPQLIKLGEKLFFDPILSKENTISCAGCHILSEGGDDNRPTAIGYHNRPNPFHLNTPTVLNAALEKFQFWDARAKTLEEQATGPMTAPFEMAMTPQKIIQKLKQSHYYQEFQNIFEDGLTWQNLTKAIAAYERTLLTRGRFDDFLDGNLTALNQQEKKGLRLFMEIGCIACHNGRGIGGQLIQKFPIKSYNNFFYPQFIFKNHNYYFKQIVFQKPRFRYFPFNNIGGYLGKDDAQRFKVPLLRNIAKTAPYFHNGSVEKLEKAIEIMGKYQRGLDLNQRQIKEIAAFLKSLNGQLIEYRY